MVFLPLPVQDVVTLAAIRFAGDTLHQILVDELTEGFWDRRRRARGVRANMLGMKFSLEISSSTPH